MKKRASRQTRNKQVFSVFNMMLLTAFTPAAAYLVFLIVSYNFLDFYYLNLLVAGALVVIFAVSLRLLLTRRGKWLTRGLLLFAIPAIGLGIYAARSAIDFSKKLNQTARLSQTDMSIVVAADSPLTNIEQVTHVLTVTTDQDNATKVLEGLTHQKSLSPEVSSVSSYQEAYKAILADGNKAMVLNGGFASLLEEVAPDFLSKIRTLHTFSLEKEMPASPGIGSADAFNVYISGIDSYGPISGVSRSDVNIIMTVNRKTNNILLTTTPRDAYVPIAGGGNNQLDKLTHAGIYGVDSSIQTLENLYGIDIHYYVRLNFTSFVQLIDLVGGIEVDNDQEFTSLHGNHHFPVGAVHLDAEKALVFVRERYSLQNGDVDRGKNQMKVITALIKKLTAIKSLNTFTGIIDQLNVSIQTDMPLATLMDLINGQLAANNQYQVTSQALTGRGSTGELSSYAMPDAALYMVSIDSVVLSSLQQSISDVMEGR